MLCRGHIPCPGGFIGTAALLPLVAIVGNHHHLQCLLCSVRGSTLALILRPIRSCKVATASTHGCQHFIKTDMPQSVWCKDGQMRLCCVRGFARLVTEQTWALLTWSCIQAIVDRARAALLDTRLTGEAALPSGHQAGASHPAAQGGFYMGEVLPRIATILQEKHIQISWLRFDSTHTLQQPQLFGYCHCVWFTAFSHTVPSSW